MLYCRHSEEGYESSLDGGLFNFLGSPLLKGEIRGDL